MPVFDNICESRVVLAQYAKIFRFSHLWGFKSKKSKYSNKNWIIYFNNYTKLSAGEPVWLKTPIESLQEEKRIFNPPPEFSKKAHIKSFDEYKEIYKQSIRRPGIILGGESTAA